MISTVQAGTAAYLQQVNSKEKKELAPVSEVKKMDKVESLKEQIQSGEYKIDTQKTAEAVAKDLI